ncbi:MAG: uroporphyrinogen decarboxylase family protein [Firmicutes bacterium]|jgi:hypothetical protein|nr:uroporphyrinogen decarboxylase family protein [Bacillota bacterium]
MEGARDRLLRAMRGEKADPLPVSCRFSVGFLLERARNLGIAGGPEVLHLSGVGYLLEVMDRLELDPVVLPHWWHGCTVFSCPDALLPWNPEATQRWRSSTLYEPDPNEPGRRVAVRTVTTPWGALTGKAVCQRGQRWPIEYMLKKEEDVEVLSLRPDPADLDLSRLIRLGQLVGDRGVVMFTYPGVIEEAMSLRGAEQFCIDLMERPAWVRKLLARLHEYSAAALTRLCSTGKLDVVIINNSSMSMISPDTYSRYGEEMDRDLIRVIKESGAVAVYHNCGRVMAYLDSIARIHPDVLEPLVPATASTWADADLAEVRRKLGEDVVLMGGFDPACLASGDAESIKVEARRCLAQGSIRGAKHIPFAGGTLFEAGDEQIRAFARAFR